MKSQKFTDLLGDSYNPSLVSLETQYTKLTQDEKDAIFLKLNGYSCKPPTIDQLYTDPYYMGGPQFYDHGDNIFPFWKDALSKIYPGFLTRFPYLCLSGAIGIGKSFVSKMCMAMTYARLGCMINPYRTFKLAPKPLSFIIYHKNEITADIEFKKWFEREVLVDSPFFKNIPNRPNVKILTNGPRSNRGLGSDVIFYIFGEINFWDNPEQAVDRVNSGIIRFKSRFSKEVVQMCGGFIIDSSSRGDSSATQVFLDNSDQSLTWTCAPSHWEVKPQAYEESNGKTYSIYQGDGRYAPKILGEDPAPAGLLPDMDPQRIIHAPLQTLPDCKADIYKFLQDEAGKSTNSSDSFFGGDITHLVNCCKIKNLIPEVFPIEFFDETERISDIIDPMLRLIPKNQHLFVGLDLAVIKDTCGIAIVGFDHWLEGPSGTKVPFFKCYALFGITRKAGQETSMFHIYQLIENLCDTFSIMVSADQAFSRPLFQQLERLKQNGKLDYRYISTDRTSDPAIYLKNIIQREQIEIPDVVRLQREAFDLKVISGKHFKIDHPAKASLILDNRDGKQAGSKDLWDALASATYSAQQSIAEGLEYGYSSSYRNQVSIIDKMSFNPKEEAAKTFEDMLSSIY